LNFTVKALYGADGFLVCFSPKKLRETLIFFLDSIAKRRFDSIARNVPDEIGAEDLTSNCGKYFELAILE